MAMLALGGEAKHKHFSIEYNAIPGYFLQDNNMTDPEKFDFVR